MTVRKPCLCSPKHHLVSPGRRLGAAIVSFNESAFVSYGKEQSFQRSGFEGAAFRYTTAPERPDDSSRRVR